RRVARQAGHGGGGVGAVLVFGDDEAMARRRANHRQHALVAHAADAELLLDRPPPLRLERIGCPVPYFSRFHASMSTSARSSVRSSRIGVTEMRPSLTAWKSVPGSETHTGSSPPIQ